MQYFSYINMFNSVQCDAPSCWKSLFCFGKTNTGIDKDTIRVVGLESASNGVTRSPNLPRDISNSTFASVVSSTSRIIPCFFRAE